MEEIAHGIAKPWLIGGDFNSVLYSQDRIYGNPVTAAETRDYANCVQTLGLNELTWEGEYYTWSNNQSRTDRIWSRIDRMFGNYDWMMKLGHICTEYGLPYISYHSPICLKLTIKQWTGKVPFKFFNVWADHEDFLSIVKKRDGGRDSTTEKCNISC
ncbi:uncharacterized protein LOC142177991 [Nicotiana tabacum]|uniref:Uncharacterized protein LOC142177991 n=1 Tax=Nicotiana tabacum TaxID=4097 RepID=A0AC58U1Q5_TOBAC